MMMKLTLITLVLYQLTAGVVVHAVPVNKDDSLDNYLKEVLEMLKAAMPTGIPELGIPILDPFDVPHFDIPHISESGVEVDITIDDFFIKNLATFETKNLHVDLTQLSLEFDMLIPLLRGDAVYSLDGSIFSLFPLYGNGDMYVELSQLDIKANAGLNINQEGFLQVTTLDLDADFQGIQLHLDNLLGGENFGEVINSLLNTFAPMLWDQFKDDVFDEVNNALTKVLNDVLGKCAVANIIAGNC